MILDGTQTTRKLLRYGQSDFHGSTSFRRLFTRAGRVDSALPSYLEWPIQGVYFSALVTSPLSRAHCETPRDRDPLATAAVPSPSPLWSSCAPSGAAVRRCPGLAGR